jgi:hypothetical protein
MNDDTGRCRKPWAGVLAAAAAGIGLLLVACGGSAGGSTAHQTAYQRELAYAECMRARGLPGFPDPHSDGTFTSNDTDASDFSGPRFGSADRACAHLEGPGMTPAQQQQFTRQALRFAACMRAHGITNFQYSPHGGSSGGMGVQGPGPAAGTPQFQSAQQACRKLMPGLGSGGS